MADSILKQTTNLYCCCCHYYNVIIDRNHGGTDGALQRLVQGGGNAASGRVQETGKGKEHGGCVWCGRVFQETGNWLTRKEETVQTGMGPRINKKDMHKNTGFLLSSHSDIKWRISRFYRAAQDTTLTYSLFNASVKPLIFKYTKQRPLKSTMLISRCVARDGCSVYQYRHFVLIFIRNEQLAFSVGYSVYETRTLSKIAHISPRW